jgi:hypothetical protein
MMSEDKNDLIHYIMREEDLILNEIQKNSIIGLKNRYFKKLHNLSKKYPCYENGSTDLHKGSKERLHDLWNEITAIRLELEKEIEKAYFRKKKSSKSKSKRKICKCKNNHNSFL